MATTSIGKIGLNFKDAYNASTAYVVDDVVTYLNETYICILASTGNLPSNVTYWTKLAASGSAASNSGFLSVASTVQGDIYYNAGGSIARLAPGTSGQILTTNGSSANPSWTTATANQMVTTKNTTRSTQGMPANSPQNINNMSVSITPSAATSKILILCQVSGEFDTPWDRMVGLRRTIGGTSVYLPDTVGVTRSNGSISYGFAPTWSSYDGQAASNFDSTPEGSNFHFVDTPNTTSAVTYNMTMMASNTNYLNINRCVGDDDERFVSNITAIEFKV
jgi:hypothetical protein